MNPSSNHIISNNSGELLLGLPLATPKPIRLWRLAMIKFKKNTGRISLNTRDPYVASASSVELRSSSVKHRRSSSAGPQHNDCLQLVDNGELEHHNSRSLSTKSSFHHIDIPEKASDGQQHLRSINVDQDHLRSINVDQDLKRKVDLIIRDTDREALVDFGGVPRVASVLGSDIKDGLNVEVAERSSGWNAYAKKFFQFFLEACNNLNVFLLSISFILSIWIGIIEKKPVCMWHDSMAIIFAVFVLVTVPMASNFYHEIKLRRELENKLDVTVTRRGNPPTRISISDVKEGDLLHLEKDDVIPADGLFVDGSGLMLDGVLNRKVDENSLFLYSGSKVTDGSCSMLVTSVRNTVLSEVSNFNTTRHNSIQKNLLGARIDKPSAYIEGLSLVISVLVMVVLLIRLIFKKHYVAVGSFEKPELKGHLTMAYVMKKFENIVLKPRGRIAFVSIMTVAILEFQHALPLAIAKVLCYWKKKVESADVELKNLSACCAMGLVTTICINATGRLFCKPTETEVKQFWIGMKDVTTSLGSETDTVVEGIRRVVASALKPEIFRDPQCDKLISWSKERLGATASSSDGSPNILDYKYLGSQEKGYGVLVKEIGEHGENLHLHWRGNASTILRMCSYYYDSAGRKINMENYMTGFENLVKEMEDIGLHPIALAYRKMEIKELKEEDLILLALVGLKFSYQEEIKSALKKLRDANVGIKLISDDGESTVKNIADELGLLRSGSNDLTSCLQYMTMTERSAPENKTDFIQSLQKQDHIVAYYGGYSGNDILPLKAADLRIVPNSGATEAARRMSDIVIFNNNIGSLVPIIASGKCVYHNIQIFFQHQLISCISGLLITLAATVRFGDSPISIIELILSHFIIYFSGGLLMIMEVKHPKRRAGRKEPLLTHSMWIKILFHVCYQAFILFLIQLEGQATFNVDERVTKAMVFNSFFICQIFNQFVAIKPLRKEVLDNIPNNYWFLFFMGIVIALQVLVVLYAARVIHGICLSGTQQLICFLIAAFPWGLYFNFQLAKSALLLEPSATGGSQHARSTVASRLPYYLGIPFSMIFLFYTSYLFNPGPARTFR